MIGPTVCAVCFQFTAINSLYMFPALFAHHQEVLYVQQLVYFVYCVGWLLAGLEWNSVPPDDDQISAENMHRLLIVIN
jgi:hypothetical protein